MPQVIQAKCPGCKKTLHIPAEWVGESLRCKHCGMVVQAKVRPAAAKPSPPVAPPAPTPPAFNGAPANETAPPESPFPDPGLAPLVQVMGRYRRGRRSRWILPAVGVAVLLLTAALGYFFRDSLTQAGASLRDLVSGKADEQPGAKKAVTQSHAADVFPRRALIICVNNYLYANPVSYGVPDHNVSTLLDRLHRALHINSSQVAELSDAARPSQPAKGKTPPAAADTPARPPLKPVIEKAITEFLGTCRAQDRILLMFIGHVIEEDGEAYLVPLEGDFKTKETLIPLKWLYDRLKACKARQKVLVVDTCRLDPARGLERPGSGPMGEKLGALLAKPPDGVQVWAACSAGEYSYELDGNSVFIEELTKALTPKALAKAQKAQDPLPVEALAGAVAKSTAAEVTGQLKARQTPRLSGREADGGAAHDNQEPLPPRVVIPPPTPAEGGTAKPEDVRAILAEVDLPPIKLAREETAPQQVEVLVPFSAKALADYRADYTTLAEIKENPQRYPLRLAVLQAVELMREKFNPQAAAVTMQEYFSGASNEAIKTQILKDQREPAKVMAELREALDDLEKAGEQRDTEPSKRWQAHYDYVMAQLLARIVYLEEYSLALGRIRKDALDPLQNGQTGYRLASRTKLQGDKNFKDLAKKSEKILEKLAKKYKNTPWEILAKRAQLTALGLEWQPTR